jgi:hypothetical protein
LPTKQCFGILIPIDLDTLMVEFCIVSKSKGSSIVSFYIN